MISICGARAWVVVNGYGYPLDVQVYASFDSAARAVLEITRRSSSEVVNEALRAWQQKYPDRAAQEQEALAELRREFLSLQARVVGQGAPEPMLYVGVEEVQP